uniref:Uncharacterized protein n=1 Tax=Timema douglasi TaxID=61478 RepID=A0A7R8VZ09_TIMDO|nr:unnamed protein product [Timema douglasi]
MRKVEFRGIAPVRVKDYLGKYHLQCTQPGSNITLPVIGKLSVGGVVDAVDGATDPRQDSLGLPAIPKLNAVQLIPRVCATELSQESAERRLVFGICRHPARSLAPSAGTSRMSSMTVTGSARNTMKMICTGHDIPWDALEYIPGNGSICRREGLLEFLGDREDQSATD